MSEIFAVPGEVREILALLTKVNQEIVAELGQLNTKVDTLMSSVSAQQADINAAVTAVTSLLTDIGNQTTQILAAVTAVQQDLANGTPVDTTALDSAVSGIQAVDSALDTAVTSLAAVATPPATGTPPTSPTAQDRHL